MHSHDDELLVLAEALGEVKTKTEKLEAEFSTQARPLEAATNALSATLSGIKALQFHVIDNNLGALSARVEEMRKAVDEQVGVIALELKKADESNAAKAGQEADALRSEIAGLQAQLGTLGAQFEAQLARVEFAAKEEAKKLQLIPGPAGEAGASLNPRGTFIDGQTYNRLDVVSWLGSSYIATVDGVTEKPSKTSTQWQVLASRGNGGGGTASLNDMLGAPSAGTIVGSEGSSYVRKTLVAGANIAISETPSTITITGTEGEISLEDGSAASPSLFFTNDPDTGIYRPGSNQVGISLGGSAQAVLTSTTFTVTPNLVVSGTGTSSIGGNATVAGTLGVGPSSTLGTVNITTPNLTYGTVYLNGATTGADFMRLKSSGADGVFGIESSVGSAILSGSSANATVLYSVGSNPLQFGTAGTVKGTLTSGGNLLIGTTTDSSNGKLQLADHTTSAGGIGFGTDISLYRVNPNSFKIGLSAANFTLDAGGSGTGGARIVGGGGLTLTSNTGESLYLQSGGLVGITINSSQQVHVNATTASTSSSTGALTVGGGVGVAGNLNIGGELQISSAYPAFKLTDTNSNSDFTILNDNGRLAVYDETNAAYRLTIGATGGVKIGTTPEDVGANNLTVQGTLAVSGGSVTLTGAAYSIFYADGSSGGNFTIRKAGVAYGTLYGNETNTVLDSAGSANLIFQTGGATRGTFTSSGLTVAGTLTLGAITTPRGKLDSQQTYNGAAPSTSATPIIRANNGGAISLWTCGQGYDAMWLQAIQDDGANLSKSLLINPLGSNVELGSTSSQVLVKGTTASTSTSTGALVVSGGVGVAKEVYVGKTCKVGTGSDNEGYTNVFTNKAENTAGPFDITLPSDCVGVVFLNSYQSGVGRSFREIPFICFGGTVTLGTSRTTVLTADPVTSVAAAASSKITISLYAGNTNCYWGIYVNKS